MSLQNNKNNKVLTAFGQDSKIDFMQIFKA